ncbi:apolipoprotein N-acyltransferase [Bailinhaonella thermotolerans]|uniref:Apolipoprotein N-acyltransferase n=2 Tax=Bailinhaonella thermotolerans TaxID=1070861 RepID=A0A3A4BDJ2_9ACTN|nr:apolipoprotein N-acyltransferase [Bailinhaonella thermotolerans]
MAREGGPGDPADAGAAVTGAPPPSRVRRLPWPRMLLAAAGGVLLYLAFPPIDWWPLAPAGIALLTLSLRGLRPRRAAWIGMLGGLVFFFPMFPWTRPIGEDAWVFLSVFESLYFLLQGIAVALVTRLRCWPPYVAAVWVLQELVRGNWPYDGFPWARVAFSQTESPYTPFAALGGAPLVTFATALSGALLAWAAVRLAPAVTGALRGARGAEAAGDAAGAGNGAPEATAEPARRAAGTPYRWAALAVLGAVVVPALAVAVPRPGAPGRERTVNIGVIQGNVPGHGMYFLGDEPAIVLRNHANKTHEMAAAVRAGRLPRPDLVIWPENSTDIDPYKDRGAYEIIDAAVRDIGVPVMVGAVVHLDDGVHRQTRSIVWNPGTGPGPVYNKKKLVPFGEFVPMRALLEKIFERISLVGRESLAGTTSGAIRQGPVLIGAVNCYEVAFDDAVRDTVRDGGTPLAVQTNNATYSFTSLPPQQTAMSKLRAVEHNRAIVTAATTGISALVDPDGTVRWQTRERVPDMRVDSIPVRTETTIATRVGAVPEWVLTLIGVGAIVFAALRSRRETAAGGAA